LTGTGDSCAGEKMARNAKTAAWNVSLAWRTMGKRAERLMEISGAQYVLGGLIAESGQRRQMG